MAFGTQKGHKSGANRDLSDELDLVVEVVRADAGAGVHQEDQVDLLPRMLPELTDAFLQNSAENVDWKMKGRPVRRFLFTTMGGKIFVDLAYF